MKKFQSSSTSLVALAFGVLIISSMVKANGDYGLVKDIYAGSTSSGPIGLTSVGGQVFFAATGENVGKELYTSNGEEDGTMMLRDINPAGDSNPSGFVEFRDRVYFRADDGVHGVELWVTDGTEEGTTLFVDVNEGSAPSNPSGFIVVGNRMVFEATTAEHGRELWVTDGTQGGTELLEDIREGTEGSSPSVRAEYKIGNDILLFTADDGINGRSLYSSNAIPGRATLLKSVTADADGIPQSIFVGRPLDDDVEQILFTVGDELWVTDGTTSGTTRINENISIDSDSRISSYKLDGKTLFFGKEVEGDTDSLWETDGTSSGTRVLFPGLETSFTDVSRTGASTTIGISFGPVIGDKISFFTDNGIGVDVWVTDGDDIDLLISKSFDFVLSVKPSADGEQAVFVMSDGNDMQLYSSDYTEVNTKEGPSFPNGISSGSGEMVSVEGEDFVLFTVNAEEYGVELWRFTLPERESESPTASPVSPPTSPNPPDFDSAPLSTFGLVTILAFVAGVVILY